MASSELERRDSATLQEQREIERRQREGDPTQYPTPDFVMLGIQDKGGGVVLFASKVLSQVQLSEKIAGYLSACEGDHPYPQERAPVCPGMHVPVRLMEVHVEMGDITMIRADDYGQALRDLMTTWRLPEEETFDCGHTSEAHPPADGDDCLRCRLNKEID